MTLGHDTGEQQAERLVEAIRAQVAAAVAAIASQAAAEADAIRRRARDDARRQARRALAELRAAEQRALQQARAELETARRQRDSVRARQVLDAAWPRLAPAIERCWAEPSARSRWIAAQLALARRRLAAPPWTLRHPAGDGVAADVRAALERAGLSGVALQPDPALVAGLVIEADGAALDSTPAALLADRAAVEAELLAQLDREPEAGGG